MKMHNSGGNPGFPFGPLDLLRDEVLSHFEGVAETQRDVRTVLPYLSFIRFTRPTELTRGMLEPSMCLVLQGKKKVLIGSEIWHYGRGSYVLSAIDMPVSGQVSEASLAEPYLGVRIALDAQEIAAQIIEHKLAVPKNAQPRAAAYVEAADAELQDAFLRLARLLKKPRDLAVLAPLVKQEILYRLISARNGGLLGQTVLSHHQEKGVNQAIHWIKTNYAEPMHIEQLAKAVSMSVSNLHHRFKAITVMSPLQYQKQVRLLEARKLLLGGNIEAATVAFKVGYESPSQFSREYRRLFGASPLQDMEYLKHHELDQ
jgi:AraC-like DNA-binding protein